MKTKSQSFIYFDREKHHHFPELIELAIRVETVIKNKLPKFIAIRCQDRVTVEDIEIENKFEEALILPYPGYLYFSDEELTAIVTHGFLAAMCDARKDSIHPMHFIKEHFASDYSEAMMVAEYFIWTYKLILKKIRANENIFNLHSPEVLTSVEFTFHADTAAAAVCAFCLHIPITKENKEKAAQRLKIRKTNQIANSIKLINLHKLLEKAWFVSEDTALSFPDIGLTFNETSDASNFLKYLNMNHIKYNLKPFHAIELRTEPMFDHWDLSTKLTLVAPWPFIEGLKTWEISLMAEYYQLLSKFSDNKNDQFTMLYTELIKKYSLEKIIFASARLFHHCERRLDFEDSLKSSRDKISYNEFKEIISTLIDNLKTPISEKCVHKAIKEICDFLKKSNVDFTLNEESLRKVLKENMIVEENVFTNLDTYNSISEQMMRLYLSKINEFIAAKSLNQKN